ncbi:MAG TPA: HlyD family efflux transporter periplasmic adaptor subunit, partial [Pseudobdellovibrionaceae bacterium]|nr:HlyD family efflux transporter periplasmic adaptor subunit [Pseudobdellovibrionaceae bacterium]
MKRIFYILTAVLIVSFIFILARPRPIDVEAVRIVKGDFEESIVSDGRVRAKTRQTVYAKATGTLEKIQIKLGDRLDANQVVGVLEWDIRKNVVSPITGVVTKVFRDSAGPINRGEPIFEVSAVDELEVVTELLTTDAIRLDKNSSAKITNWGGAVELKANVKKISRAGTMKVSPLGVEEERTEVILELNQVSPEISAKLGDNY